MPTLESFLRLLNLLDVARVFGCELANRPKSRDKVGLPEELFQHLGRMLQNLQCVSNAQLEVAFVVFHELVKD